jgi:hypothetical protein
MGRVTPFTHVGPYLMAHCHLPSPDFHRLDWQPYGLHPQETKDDEKSAAASGLISCAFFRFFRPSKSFAVAEVAEILGFFRARSLRERRCAVNTHSLLSPAKARSSPRR